jgi:hypothetical protein
VELHERRVCKRDATYIVGGHLHPFVKVGAEDLESGAGLDDGCGHRVQGLLLPSGTRRLCIISRLARRAGLRIFDYINLCALAAPAFLCGIVVYVATLEGLAGWRVAKGDVVNVAETFLCDPLRSGGILFIGVRVVCIEGL